MIAEKTYEAWEEEAKATRRRGRDKRQVGNQDRCQDEARNQNHHPGRERERRTRRGALKEEAKVVEGHVR